MTLETKNILLKVKEDYKKLMEGEFSSYVSYIESIKEIDKLLEQSSLVEKQVLFEDFLLKLPFYSDIKKDKNNNYFDFRTREFFIIYCSLKGFN